MATPVVDKDLENRLKKVISFAKGNPRLIREGLRRNLRGVTDHARYNYLWSEIGRRANFEIKKSEKKGALQNNQAVAQR